jgi:hypothetical protein
MARLHRPLDSRHINRVAGCLLALAVLIMFSHARAVSVEAEIMNAKISRVPPPPQLPVVETSTVAVTEVATSETTTTDTTTTIKLTSDQENLRLQLTLLEAGLEKMKEIPDYTSTFSKREEVNGVLMSEQVMELKLRHKPFSVYMYWIKGDTGRELLYQEGLNDNMMWVQLGGFAGKLIPALKLDPDGERAKAESRYSITSSGIANIAEKIANYRRDDLKLNRNVVCQKVDTVQFDNRDCYYFVSEYKNIEESKIYRKNELYIDKEWSVPVCVRNYTWNPKDRKLTEEQLLIEEYAFTDVQFDKKFANQDFEKANDEYSFR